MAGTADGEGKTALDMAWLARAEGYGILEDCLQLLEDAEQRAWVRRQSARLRLPPTHRSCCLGA